MSLNFTRSWWLTEHKYRKSYDHNFLKFSRKNLKYLDILLLFRSSECHHNRWNFCQNCVCGWQSHSRVYRDRSPATANPVVPCRWSIARGINRRRWIPAYPERPAFIWRYIQMWSHQQSWLCTVSGHHLCARFVLIHLFLVWLVVWPNVCLFACSLFFSFFFLFLFRFLFRSPYFWFIWMFICTKCMANL